MPLALLFQTLQGFFRFFPDLFSKKQHLETQNKKEHKEKPTRPTANPPQFQRYGTSKFVVCGYILYFC